MDKRAGKAFQRNFLQVARECSCYSLVTCLTRGLWFCYLFGTFACLGANKQARMIWAILAKGEEFDTNAWNITARTKACPTRLMMKIQSGVF